jgi:hypothetical protein
LIFVMNTFQGVLINCLSHLLHTNTHRPLLSNVAITDLSRICHNRFVHILSSSFRKLTVAHPVPLRLHWTLSWISSVQLSNIAQIV